MSDCIGPLHLCVNLGFVCAQSRHIFIGIKIKVVAGGQHPLPVHPLPVHTHTHIDTVNSCLSFSQQPPFSLVFFPQLHLLRLKGF